MSRTGRQRRSRGELIRQRARAQFVGRREQLSLFTENLAKDPESDRDPAEYLFQCMEWAGWASPRCCGSGRRRLGTQMR